MKRALVVPLSLVVVLIVLVGSGWWLYEQRLFELYPEQSMTAFLGSENYRTLARAHTEYDWYIKAGIEPSDGEKLMRKRVFRTGYNSRILAGRVDEHRIEDCAACSFYFEE